MQICRAHVGFLLAALLVALGGRASLTFAQSCDVIYSGGPIITMNDAAPRAEAVAVKDGKIIAVGTDSAVADRTTLASLTTPASPSLSAATLSFTLQPEARAAAMPAASPDTNLSGSDAKPAGSASRATTSART